MKKEFTIADALKVQEEQIYKWSLVLNSDAYARLLGKVREAFKNVKLAQQVPRGTTLEQYVYDIMRDILEDNRLKEMRRLYDNVHDNEG